MIRRPPHLLTGNIASTQPPRCRHVPSVPHRNLRPGFEAQTRQNPPSMVLRPKPPNRSTHVTTDFDRPSSQVVRAPRSTCAPGILSQSTRSLPCSCARRCPKCQPLRLATRRSGPSVQASRPPFTAPGPSARHILLGLRLAVGFRIHSSAPAQHEPRNTSLDTPQCASHQ